MTSSWPASSKSAFTTALAYSAASSPDFLEDVGHPKAHQLVAPRLGLELHFLVMGELVLEGVLAIVEGGHRGLRFVSSGRGGV
jgi:hypothetical protein